MRARVRTHPEPDALSLYLADVRDHSILTRAEEAHLARRIRAGDQAALQRLVGSNLRFVVIVAKKYQYLGLSLADLIAEGNVGLVRAAQRFDETRGVKFVSYAVWWIRQSIFKALADNARIFRLPVNQATALNRLVRTEAELTQQLGRPPLAEEVAEAMDIDVREVRRTRDMGREALDLDSPAFDDDGERTLQTMIEDPYAVGPEERVDHREIRAGVRSALASLTPREAQILRLYYGLDGDRPLTLKEIGSIYNLSRERIRQIRDRAMGRLATGRRGQRLRALV